jgi:hypothetical protein
MYSGVNVKNKFILLLTGYHLHDLHVNIWYLRPQRQLAAGAGTVVVNSNTEVCLLLVVDELEERPEILDLSELRLKLQGII